MVLDPSDRRHARALARLREDTVAWLTTVSRDGQPQSAPVWFLWRDETADILVYGDKRAKRNRNLEANPRVSLHLANDEGGGSIVSIEGEARVDRTIPRVPDNSAYLRKYRTWIDDGLGGPEKMAGTYDVPLVIRPTRLMLG